MATGKKIDGWLDRAAAADHIGLTTYWLEKHASTGSGPKYIQHGRKVWYRRDDLDDWLADQRNVQASGAGGKDALESLWEMGQKRRVQTPELADLEKEYRAEHGEPKKKSITLVRKQKWAEFCKTLTAKQQRLLADYRTG